MRCLDTTFLIDYVRGEERATRRVAELLHVGERLTTPTVAAAEVLIGAHYRGGRELARTLEFLERLELLSFEAGEATEAGRLGAEALKSGTPLSGIDLLVAATSRHHRGILVTRDTVFSQVVGLAVESY